MTLSHQIKLYIYIYISFQQIIVITYFIIVVHLFETKKFMYL